MEILCQYVDDETGTWVSAVQYHDSRDCDEEFWARDAAQAAERWSCKSGCRWNEEFFLQVVAVVVRSDWIKQHVDLVLEAQSGYCFRRRSAVWGIPSHLVFDRKLLRVNGRRKRASQQQQLLSLVLEILLLHRKRLQKLLRGNGKILTHMRCRKAVSSIRRGHFQPRILRCTVF